MSALIDLSERDVEDFPTDCPDCEGPLSWYVAGEPPVAVLSCDACGQNIAKIDPQVLVERLVAHADHLATLIARGRAALGGAS